MLKKFEEHEISIIIDKKANTKNKKDGLLWMNCTNHKVYSRMMQKEFKYDTIQKEIGKGWTKYSWRFTNRNRQLPLLKI